MLDERPLGQLLDLGCFFNRSTGPVPVRGGLLERWTGPGPKLNLVRNPKYFQKRHTLLVWNGHALHSVRQYRAFTWNLTIFSPETFLKLIFIYRFYVIFFLRFIMPHIHDTLVSTISYVGSMYLLSNCLLGCHPYIICSRPVWSFSSIIVRCL
jgi:hypothetical protein